MKKTILYITGVNIIGQPIGAYHYLFPTKHNYPTHGSSERKTKHCQTPKNFYNKAI